MKSKELKFYFTDYQIATQTFNKETAIIPNSAIISSSVLNWMHGDVEGRVSVPIEVAYGTNPDLVKKLLLNIANEHPKVLPNRKRDV